MNNSSVFSEINNETPHMMTEAKSREAVEQALASSGYAELENIKCGIKSGQVELCGNVRSYHLKQLAQQAALKVLHPASVLNSIHVGSEC